MTGQDWGEWGIVGFSMVILSWVIFRITGVLIRIVNPNRDYSDEKEES